MSEYSVNTVTGTVGPSIANENTTGYLSLIAWRVVFRRSRPGVRNAQNNNPVERADGIDFRGENTAKPTSTRGDVFPDPLTSSAAFVFSFLVYIYIYIAKRVSVSRRIITPHPLSDVSERFHTYCLTPLFLFIEQSRVDNVRICVADARRAD